MITTICLSLFSLRLAIVVATEIAAPVEIPPGSPSSFASARAFSKASEFETLTISSMRSVLRMEGTNPAPIPWILCGPGSPPDKTGESSGSMATIWNEGFRCLITSPTPVSVPPVPTPEMRISTFPSVSCQISSAVVSRWILGLSGLSNCPTRNPPSRSAISLA